MRNSTVACRSRLLIAVVAATVFCIAPTTVTPASPDRQAAALADLLSGVVTCAVPPCMGTAEEDFYSLVRGQFASDGDIFVDFAVAYPGFSHHFKGVVLFEIDGAIEGMMFMLTGFHASPAAVIEELEGTGFGCEEEEDPEAGQQEWSCWRPDSAGEEVEFDLYIGNGVILVEF